MDQMGRCGGGGGLCHRLSLQVQGHGGGRAVATLPLFLRSRAHLGKAADAGAHFAEPRFCSRSLAKLPAARLQYGRSMKLGGRLCYASNGPSEPAHLAKAADCGAHVAKPPFSSRSLAKLPAARLHYGRSSMRFGVRLCYASNRPSEPARLAKAADCGAHLAKPPFSSRALAKLLAARLLCGRSTRFGGRLCYASNGGSEPPSSDDESASSLRAHVAEPAVEQPRSEPSPSSFSLNLLPSSMDLLQKKMDFVHDKLDGLLGKYGMGVKWLIWRITAAVLSVFFGLLLVITMYRVADGRSYIEEEMKAIFLSVTEDPQIKERLKKLATDGVDNSVKYILSSKAWSAWYKWLRGQ